MCCSRLCIIGSHFLTCRYMLCMHYLSMIGHILVMLVWFMCIIAYVICYMWDMHWSFMIDYTCQVGACGQVCIGLIEVVVLKVIVCN